MNYINFKSALTGFPVFSISDIRLIDGNFDRRRLFEWQAKGYIRKIIKGHYLFSDIEIDENTLYQISNKIYRPSYISFETALAYYHLIPENIYAITSASTKRTYEFQTSISHFIYKTINRKLFFGYDIMPDSTKITLIKIASIKIASIKIASMEKAVLDYFYLNSSIKTEDDFTSLRINREIFLKLIDETKFFNYLERFNKMALTERVNSFYKWIKNA